MKKAAIFITSLLLLSSCGLTPTTSETPTSDSQTTDDPTTSEPLTTVNPTTEEPSTTEEPITTDPTTEDPSTTEEPTTVEPSTTEESTTEEPTTTDPTTEDPTTTEEPTTTDPTTEDPSTTEEPTTTDPTTEEPTTEETTTSEEPTTSETPTTSSETIDYNDIESWFNYDGVSKSVLDDCIDASKAYYADINFNNSSSTLKSELGTLMKKKTGLSYSGTKEAMKDCDRDWDLSPNKSDSNPYMRLIYAEYNFFTSTAAKWNDFNTIWDREHIWAKSKGGSFGTSVGPGTDLHHLRASDKPNNNNGRNSRNFGYVTNGSTQLDYRGNSSGLYKGGNIDGVYEPVDRDKGDVARACFYMNLVYPNDCKTLTESLVGSGNALGILSNLLEWNRIDPPDEFELRRNNLIESDYQHNRNIFVDCPALADYIFG